MDRDSKIEIEYDSEKTEFHAVGTVVREEGSSL